LPPEFNAKLKFDFVKGVFPRKLETAKVYR